MTKVASVRKELQFKSYHSQSSVLSIQEGFSY